MVIDASVALAWVLEDEASPYAVAALEQLISGEAVVPHHWGLEVANGLLMAERHGRVHPDETPEVVARLLALPIAPDPLSRERDMTSSMRLARAHQLSVYDVAYLELAVRYDLPLATLDSALAVAAEQEGVGRWTPEGPDRS